MQITVNIPDEIAAEAQARGIALEKYVEQVLADRVSPTATRSVRSQQEVRSWLDSLAQFSDKIPPLPETISREWLYQEHD
jgi:hypothetical protein